MRYRADGSGPTITVKDCGPDADVGPGVAVGAYPADAGFFGAFFLPFDSFRLSRPLAMFSPLSVTQPKIHIRPAPHFTSMTINLASVVKLQ